MIFILRSIANWINDLTINNR